MYAVKNKDDKLFVVRSNDNAYLYQDQYGDLGRVLYRYYSRKDAQRAIERAGHINQCHVVELVEKPKRFVLPMEGTELPDGTVAYAVLDQTGAWTVKATPRNKAQSRSVQLSPRPTSTRRLTGLRRSHLWR